MGIWMEVKEDVINCDGPCLRARQYLPALFLGHCSSGWFFRGVLRHTPETFLAHL